MCVRVLHNVCTCESVHKNRVYVLFTSPVTCIPLCLLVFPSGDVQLLFFCFFRKFKAVRMGFVFKTSIQISSFRFFDFLSAAGARAAAQRKAGHTF